LNTAVVVSVAVKVVVMEF